MFHLTSITQNGEVLQRASTQYEHAISGGAHPDAFTTIQSEAPENTYWSFTNQAWESTGEKPSPKHYFNYATKQWTDPRTLADFKVEKWDSLKASRDYALTAPLVTPYGTFDATEKAQKSITDSVLMMQTLASLGTPITIDFTLADNSTVTLNTEQMVNVGLLLGQRTQQIYAQGRALRIALDSATTVAEVESITWNNP